MDIPLDKSKSIVYTGSMKHKTPHYEVRFHLLRGRHFMHWQVKEMVGRKKVWEYYIDPTQYQVEMTGCKLVNKINRAKKVNEEGVKDVSGWVHCDRVEYILENNGLPVDNLERLFYNPIRDVHWRRESDDNEFAWDDSRYETLVTQGKQVYILEERT